MPIQCRVAVVGVFPLLAAFLGFAARPSPGIHNDLQFLSLSSPELAEAGLPFEVSFTAADDIGIAAVEIREIRDPEGPMRIEGNGQRRLSAVVTVTPSRSPATGSFEAVVVGVDGRRGNPLPLRTIVGVDPALEGPDATRDDISRLLDPDYVRRTGSLRGARIPVFPIDPRPWWTRWQDHNGPKPFNWTAECGPNVTSVTPFGEVVECWLKKFPNVAHTIAWDEVDANAGPIDNLGTHEGTVTTSTYPSWSNTKKTELHVAFYWAWKSLHEGADFFMGEFLEPVPANQISVGDLESAVTFLDKDEAWKLYLGTVAHSLAVEIGGFVPWSIHNYSDVDLGVLLASKSLFVPGYYRWFADQVVQRSHVGYRPNRILAAPPSFNFDFLVREDIIRPDQFRTVGRLMHWGRDQMHHTGKIGAVSDGGNGISAEAYWQYRGAYPAARVIDGTTFVYPYDDALKGYTNGPLSWVPGCWGVSFFFQQTMRAVNIPASASTGNLGQTGHTVPKFWTMGYTMSHGDDVYGGWDSTPEFPADSLLLPMSTYKDWFYGAGQIGPGGLANVSRQTIEIAIDSLADELLTRYCADQAANLSHANGDVAKFFVAGGHTIYSVPQLESINLWTKLHVKAALLSYCGP